MCSNSPYGPNAVAFEFAQVSLQQISVHTFPCPQADLSSCRQVLGQRYLSCWRPALPEASAKGLCWRQTLA